MAAATVNDISTTVQGNKQVVLADLTWTSGDTYDTTLAKVNCFSFCPTTNASFGITEAAGVLTLTSGGALTGKLRAEGT